MKKYYFLSLAIALISNVAIAQNYMEPKQLQVPFINQAVNSTDYEGLSASYNLSGNTLQKVVCFMGNFYKGWVDYSDESTTKEGGVWGGSQTVMFTSKGETKDISETLGQYHVATQGVFVFHNAKKAKSDDAFLSCLYMPEDNR